MSLQLKRIVMKQMENYCPISVLPLVAKIMEHIVCNELYSFLQQHSLLTQHQTGFRPNHSTQDILIKTVDDWRKSVDNDYIVGALFSKAYEYSAANYGTPSRLAVELYRHLCCCLLSNPRYTLMLISFCFTYQGLPENQLWS